MWCALDLELPFSRSLTWYRLLLLYVYRALYIDLSNIHKVIAIFYKAIPQEQCYLIIVLMYICVIRYPSVSVDEMSPLSIIANSNPRDNE